MEDKKLKIEKPIIRWKCTTNNVDSIYNIQNTDKDENETDLYFLKDFSYAENEIDEKIWR